MKSYLTSFAAGLVLIPLVVQADTPQTAAVLEVERSLPNSTFLCSGHVAGVPNAEGKPGPYISWRAYELPVLPEIAIAKFKAILLQEPTHSTDGCKNWRFDDHFRHQSVNMQQLVSVCPTSATGPWATCSALSNETKSVVITSEMTSSR